MGGKLGKHLVLDAIVSNTDRFNADDLSVFFQRLAASLDMQILFGPEFVEVELDQTKLVGDKFQDEGGITGMCVISTSHISIHTWVLRKFISLDVFSCKDFNVDIALREIDDTFGLIKSAVTVIDRVAPSNSEDFGSMQHFVFPT